MRDLVDVMNLFHDQKFEVVDELIELRIQVKLIVLVDDILSITHQNQYLVPLPNAPRPSKRLMGLAIFIVVMLLQNSSKELKLILVELELATEVELVLHGYFLVQILIHFLPQLVDAPLAVI